MKKYLFRLYVAGKSANSLLAVTNLEQFCSDLPAGSFEIEVLDVLAKPKLALSAGILVTPTLELASPGQPQRIIGTLKDAGMLRAILTTV
jgi:circadian clock protein KaiB